MKPHTLLVGALAAALLLSGCRTYFGYETREEIKDVAGSAKKVKSEFVRYNTEVKDGEIQVSATMKETYEKEVETVENRTHKYGRNDGVWLPRIIVYPLAMMFDITESMSHKWNLEPVRPNFFRMVSYAPPLSWFMPVIPPYWFREDHYYNYEAEEVVLRQEKVTFSENTTQRLPLTDSVALPPVKITVAGQKFELATPKPLLGLLPHKPLPPRVVDVKVQYGDITEDIKISSAQTLSEQEQALWRDFDSYGKVPSFCILHERGRIESDAAAALLMEHVGQFDSDGIELLHGHKLLTESLMDAWLSKCCNAEIVLRLYERGVILREKVLSWAKDNLMSCSVKDVVALHSQKLLSPEQFRKWFKAQKPTKLTITGLQHLSSAGLVPSEECESICRVVIDTTFRAAMLAAHKDDKSNAETALKKLEDFGWKPSGFWQKEWLKSSSLRYSEYYAMLAQLMGSRISADKYTAACIILKGEDCPIPQCVAGRLVDELRKDHFLDNNMRSWFGMKLVSSIPLYRVCQRDYSDALKKYDDMSDAVASVRAEAARNPFATLLFGVSDPLPRYDTKLLRQQYEELPCIIDSPDADSLVQKVKNVYVSEYKATLGDFYQNNYKKGQWVVKKFSDHYIVEFSGYGTDGNLNIIKIKISPDGRFWNIDEWLKTGTFNEPLVNVAVDSSPSML